MITSFWRQSAGQVVRLQSIRLLGMGQTACHNDECVITWGQPMTIPREEQHSVRNGSCTTSNLIRRWWFEIQL